MHAIAWTKQMLRELGTMPDQELAERYGISQAAVNAKRRAIGIKSVSDKWTPARDAMLGTMPDPVAAKRLGMSRGAVYLRRKKLGIPPCPYRRTTRNAQRRKHMLRMRRQGRTLREIGDHFGVSRQAVHRAIK